MYLYIKSKFTTQTNGFCTILLLEDQLTTKPMAYENSTSKKFVSEIRLILKGTNIILGFVNYYLLYMLFAILEKNFLLEAIHTAFVNSGRKVRYIKPDTPKKTSVLFRIGRSSNSVAFFFNWRDAPAGFYPVR